jgi:hypothetical protein
MKRRPDVIRDRAPVAIHLDAEADLVLPVTRRAVVRDVDEFRVDDLQREAERVVEVAQLRMNTSPSMAIVRMTVRWKSTHDS